MSRKRHENETKSGDTITFAGHVYDRAREELWTADRRLVRLRPQSGQVLAMLARAPGEVVPKQALIEGVWPGVFTTDDSLVQCIGDIRRVLGRDAIETFPRKGYRLRIEARPRPPTGRRRAAAVGVTALLGVVAMLIVLGTFRDLPSDSPGPILSEPSLAILPFSNLGGDPNVRYLSDGLSEDLATDLSQVPSLRVISPASSFVYRGEENDFSEIGQALGVRHLVRVALVDTMSGETIWAERFDKTTEDVFTLQDEVTGEIVSALSLELAADHEKPRRVDPDAYDLLLRGLEPLRQFTAAGNLEARRYFERAIALDPNYARAHANLALSYGRDVVFRYGEDSADKKIRQGMKAADDALRLDQDIPQVHFALGVLNLALRRHDDALAAARHAIEIDPNYADGHALLAQVSAHGGDLEEGLAAMRRAKMLHPRFPFSYLWIEGHLLFLQGRFTEALPLLEEAVARNPAFYVGLVTLAATYGHVGMTDAAEWTVAEALALNAAFSIRNEIAETPYRFAYRRRLLEEGLERAGVRK